MKNLRTSFILLLGFILLPFSLFSAEPQVKSVKIDPETNWGLWEGWGVSLCWWAKVFGDRDDLADVLFTAKDEVMVEGKTYPGLGLNIVRYNAGACSWNEIDGRKMAVSKIILPYRQMEGFWLDGKNIDPQSDSWDWKVDAQQRAMLLKAKARGADRFELFSNAPMWWMCFNGNPSGGASKTADNLPREQYENFARYLAEIARQAKNQWGITFTTVEPFNEPISGWWFNDCKQEGCYFSQQTQANFLPFLRAELDRRGLKDMAVAASDETSYDHGLKTWKSFGTEAKALVDQVNVHGYQGIKGPRNELYEAVVVKEKKRLWNSEYGEKIGDGLEMARCLSLDFQNLHPSAWCYWQALDGGGWGLFDTDMKKMEIKAANPKYFVLAQYTRHILPGMDILGTSDGNTVAAYSSESRRLVLVTFNDGPASRMSFDLSAFAVPDGVVKSVVTEPKGTARYLKQPDLSLAGGHFNADLPANSIQTFEMTSVSLKP